MLGFVERLARAAADTMACVCLWRSSVPKLVNQYLAGEIPLEEFVTDRMKLDDINQAFDKLHEGSCLRCVIDMT